MNRMQQLAILGMGLAVEAGVKAYKPPGADCERCVYRTQYARDGGHCYMFKDRPDRGWCAQFRAEPPASQTVDAPDPAVEALRAERRRRKQENFLKRQPKAKP